MNQRGFLMIELLVATIITGVLTLVIGTFFVNAVLNSARSETLTILQSNTKQAVETMAKDVKAARTIEAINAWPDANGPGGPTQQYGWASSSGSPSTLVLAVPAQDSSGNLLYGDSAHNVLKTNDVVYFIANPGTKTATLYRRVIANPDASNAAKTTCPAASASASCPADGKVIEDVANLVIQYYNTSNTTIATPTASYSVNMILTEYRTKFGRTFTSTLNSQATLRNKP